MTETLIRWRLREVMARYKIKAIDLAKEMGISANSVSNLRQSDTMPRLDGDSLNRLCNALNNLAIDKEEEITPMVLIQYTRDLDPDDNLNPSVKPTGPDKDDLSVEKSQKPNRHGRSTLSVITVKSA